MSRLAQGLLRSGPTYFTSFFYGDCSAIGHDWEGEKANRAFVLSWGSGNVTLCRLVMEFGLLAGLEEQPLVPP